ncbi:hypothetical protein NX059_005879 [Plenodomus lindquistii]|nr:hypothetical protein NX059_005879 [Plenodomus lindquistii]
MVYGRTPLLILRALALVLALVALGLSAWSQYVVHDFEIHGPAALDAVSSESPDSAKNWRDYFTAARNAVPRICISIGAATFAFVALITVIYTTSSSRQRIPTTILVPIEILSMCAMATAFGTSLSFSASLNTFTQNQLAKTASSELASYIKLVPLSKGLVVLACIGWFATLVTSILASVDACNRAIAKEAFSFRPTASALGMSPKYPAISPQIVRSRVPSMYDPRRPLHAYTKSFTADTEETAGLIREEEHRIDRDSVVTEDERCSVELEKEFEGLFTVDKPEKALQLRTTRPWSESPMGRKRDDDVVQSV